jgi:hypothetical protein
MSSAKYEAEPGPQITNGSDVGYDPELQSILFKNAFQDLGNALA